jgi:hypothetical protein
LIKAARKASTTYYPTLHLEIARYCALALAADYALPQQIMRLIEPPPTQYRKIDGHARDRMMSQGLDGGRHLGRTTHGAPGFEAGRGMPSSAPLPTHGQPIDDRHIFQGARAPAARKFSPAPQLTTDIGGGHSAGNGANGKQAIVLDVAWD